MLRSTLAVTTTALLAQLASACNYGNKYKDNLCNGEQCSYDWQCASGWCPDDLDRCMFVLPVWAIVLIVLGSILFCVGIVILICCCCCKGRTIKYNQKLERHSHHYYDSHGNMLAAPAQGAYQ